MRIAKGYGATAIVEATFEVAPVAALVAQGLPLRSIRGAATAYCFRTSALNFQCSPSPSLKEHSNQP